MNKNPYDLPPSDQVIPNADLLANNALRAMRELDIPRIMQIENEAYEFPWTAGIFSDCLRVGYHCLVLELGREICGYGVMSVAVGECHLLNICIHPVYQHQGLGTQLVALLLHRARDHKANTALLEVRKSNQAAYGLYLKMGFDEIGIRHGYYPARKGREDAIILAKALC